VSGKTSPEPGASSQRQAEEKLREALEKLRDLRRAGILTEEQFEDEERRLSADARRDG